MPGIFGVPLEIMQNWNVSKVVGEGIIEPSLSWQIHYDTDLQLLLKTEKLLD